jgi:hypothetical protein
MTHRISSQEQPMRLGRVAFAISLMGASIYILLPTADEIVIHPIFGLFLANVFNIRFVYGVILSAIIYRGVGITCLLTALIIGGKPVYQKLKERIRRKKRPAEKIQPSIN